jgi:hypothetical protein
MIECQSNIVVISVAAPHLRTASQCLLFLYWLLDCATNFKLTMSADSFFSEAHHVNLAKEGYWGGNELSVWWLKVLWATLAVSGLDKIVGVFNLHRALTLCPGTCTLQWCGVTSKDGRNGVEQALQTCGEIKEQSRAHHSMR